MAEYPINKGIGRPVEFKGLKAQYLFLFAGGLLAAFILFISPCSPYRAFSAKVCHTRTEDDAAPKPIHIHWSMPTI